MREDCPTKYSIPIHLYDSMTPLPQILKTFQSPENVGLKPKGAAKLSDTFVVEFYFVRCSQYQQF